MVLAGKIFKLYEKASINSIAPKLRNFRREESFKQDSYSFTLVSEVKDLALRMNMLRGLFVFDRILYIVQRDGVVPTIATSQTPFYFTEYGDKTLLLILQKKHLANKIANWLSDIIFIKPGGIVEVRIPQERLRGFHEENPEGTRLIWFDNVDLPNISKLSLAGQSLADTSLYVEYRSHGDIWYLVFKSKKYGYIAGLTKNGIVTLFSKVKEDDFITYVIDEVLPLLA